MLCIIIRLINSKNLINYLKLMNLKNNNKMHLCYTMSNAIIAIYFLIKPNGSYTTIILKQLFKKKMRTKNL
jgi:hypothetical protein